MLNGARKFVPSELELLRIENRQPIAMKIYFLDGSFVTMAITPQTNARALCRMMAAKLKLRNGGAFALYEMEEIGVRSFNERELSAYTARREMDLETKMQREMDLPMERAVSGDERLMDA